MRRVTFTRAEFGHVVYPAVAGSAPGDLQRAAVAIRLLGILEEAGERPDVTWEDMAAARPILCTMRESEHTFALPDPEFGLLVSTLQDLIGRVPAGFARLVRELVERIMSTPREME